MSVELGNQRVLEEGRWGESESDQEETDRQPTSISPSGWVTHLKTVQASSTGV